MSSPLICTANDKLVGVFTTVEHFENIDDLDKFFKKHKCQLDYKPALLFYQNQAIKKSI